MVLYGCADSGRWVLVVLPFPIVVEGFCVKEDKVPRGSSFQKTLPEPFFYFSFFFVFLFLFLPANERCWS